MPFAQVANDTEEPLPDQAGQGLGMGGRRAGKDAVTLHGAFEHLPTSEAQCTGLPQEQMGKLAREDRVGSGCRLASLR
ncbi:hypothetical protein ASF71_17270 [Deinococcus sp. Leaf326]|nr:hypothetical protein ASF71_17270 [Deinococcus sp. Leaf326]